MELHRSRGALVISTVFLAFGAFLLCSGATSSPVAIVTWLFGALAVLMGGGLLVRELKPFRFVIGVEGLILRVAGLNRLVPWAEIDAIVLDEPIPYMGDRTPISPSLLLVPAAISTIDRPLTAQSPLDGRACLPILDLFDVRQSADEVAAALARFGGGRFTDVRQLRRARFDSPSFTVGLPGYDPTRVDELIRRGQDALMSSDIWRRRLAKLELEQARAALPVAVGGYDCRQVDALLEELSATLARWDGEGAAPG